MIKVFCRRRNHRIKIHLGVVADYLEYSAMKKSSDVFNKLSIALLVLSTVVFGKTAFGQSPLSWPKAAYYDDGSQTSVSIAPSGSDLSPYGRAIEFHRSQKNVIWYRIGRVDRLNSGDYFVNWANSVSLNYEGSRPSIAVTKEGYIVLVYTKSAYTGYGSEVQMRYWVGKFDLAGDNFTIDWKVRDAFYDNGQFARVSFNANNILVDVHRSARTSILYYRIGHLRNPSAGQFDIVWDSGGGGKDYDKGTNASISINDRNQIVEVHQTETEATRLYYRRGQLNTDNIAWASNNSALYDNDSKQPAVALTNQSKLIEAASRNGSIFARTGNLNTSDSARIDWSNAIQIDSGGGYPGSSFPSIATNGILVIATWESSGKLYYAITPVVQ